MQRGKRLIQGSLLNTALLLLNVGVAFYMMPFLVSSLGDRMYGLWALVGSFVGYYGLLDLGLSIAIGRYISKAIGAGDQKEVQYVAGTAFYLFSILGLLVVLSTVILIFSVPLIMNTEQDINLVKILIFIVGINTAISFPVRVFNSILRSNLRFDIISYINAATFLLRTSAIIIFIKSGYGVLAIGIITFCVSIIDYVLTIYFSCKYGFNFSSIKFSREHAKKIFKFSFFSFVAQISDLLKFHIDSMVITIFLGLSLVTPYQIALRLFQYGGQLVAKVMNVVMPIFSQEVGKKDFDSLRIKFLLTTKISTFVSFFICSGLIMFTNAFFGRWLDKSYPDIYLISIILAVAGLFSMSQKPSVSVLYATAKHHYYAYLNAVEGIANLILSIILVQKYGIVGVAFGTAIPSIIIKIFFQPFIACRSIKQNLYEYFSMLILDMLKLGTLCTVFFLLFRQFITPSYLNIISLVSLYGVFYCLIGIFMVFKKEERLYLLGFFKK